MNTAKKWEQPTEQSSAPETPAKDMKAWTLREASSLPPEAAAEGLPDPYTRDPYGSYSDEPQQHTVAHRAGQPEAGVIDASLSGAAAAARTAEGEPLAAVHPLFPEAPRKPLDPAQREHRDRQSADPQGSGDW